MFNIVIKHAKRYKKTWKIFCNVGNANYLRGLFNLSKLNLTGVFSRGVVDFKC